MSRHRVHGLLDRKTGQFFPYPLPFAMRGFDDDPPFELQLKRGEPEGYWYPYGDTPWVVEFAGLIELPPELSAYLHRRAQQLALSVDMLPAVAEDLTWQRQGIRRRAYHAIEDWVVEAVLHWAHLSEAAHPTKLKVPKWLETDDGRRRHATDVIHSRLLREEARSHLSGSDLAAFDAYCQEWDAAHGGLCW